LIPSTTYYVRVTNSGKDYKIKDYSGNAMTQEKTWSFTTEAASSTPTFSIESLIISPDNPSATSDNITFTLNFDDAVTDIISPWRTSSSADTTACSNQAIQFFKDTEPNNCAIWKYHLNLNKGDPIYSNDYKTLELTVLSSTFSSSGEYTLKIPSNTLNSLDFTKKAEEYTKSVTLAP